MTKVTGNLWDVSKAATRATEIRVHAREPRTSGNGVITTEDVRVGVNNGLVSFECEPGWALMWIMGGGRVHEEVPLYVPGGATATLAECVNLGSDIGEYAPETLAGFVAEVRKSVADAQDILGRVSEQSKSAKLSESAAGSSASTAKSHADTAKTHADAAGRSRDSAKSYADGASGAERRAIQAEGAAAGSALSASTSERNAAQSAQSAKADAERVATIAGSTRWVGTKVEVNGKLSPELMPKITVSSKGTWVVNGSDTGVRAQGEPGKDGSTRFEDLTPAQRESLRGVQGERGPKGDRGEPGPKGDPAKSVEQVQITDARGVDETPAWYMQTYPLSVINEFKTSASVGLDQAGGEFVMVSTVIPWWDSSGGYPSQTAYQGDTVWWRVGVSSASWSEWRGAPGPHRHQWSEIDGKPVTFPAAWGDVVGRPTVFPPATHRHQWSEIDGKPELAAATHTHTVSDLSDISGGVRDTLKSGTSTTSASGAGAVAWGRGAKATGTDAVALGYDTQASGVDSAALGSYSKVTQQYHVVVGVDATDATVSQQRGTVIIGKTGAPVYIAGRNLNAEIDTLNQKVGRVPDAAFSNDVGKGYENRPVKSGADGKIFTYTPVAEVTNDKELVAKGYVDQQVGTRPKIELVTTPGTDPTTLYLIGE